mmetsp:Transcript_23331/g.20715  ORF Transcript_23331/g.20715 Transcript_23331/m.20715 type:complete len:123 (+) Transcript_23331:578-946(+)
MVKFILAPIVCDNRFNIKKLKTTKGFEIDIVKSLLEKSKLKIKNKYFKGLKAIAKDKDKILGLGIEGIIKKDAKNFKFQSNYSKSSSTTCGISTCKISLEDFTNKFGMEEIIKTISVIMKNK